MRCLITILMCGAMLCFVAHTRAELASGIRAVVNDTVITDYQVKSTAGHAIDLLQLRYANNPEEFQKRAAETLQNALEQLVERQLIVHDFTTAGYNLPETIIDEAVRDRIREMYGDRMTLVKSLQAEGMTLDKLRRQIREQIIVVALRQKNVSSALIISPHKIETYYKEHRDDFKVEDRVKLRMIVLDRNAAPTAAGRKKLAQEILAKIKEGAAFPEMASVYSTGSQKSQGGDWGWARRGELFKGLSEIAFALQPGKPSHVIGYSGQPKDYWICQYDEAGQPIPARHFTIDPDTKKEQLVEERSFDDPSSVTNAPPADVCYLLLVEENVPAHMRPLSEVRGGPDGIEETLLREERARLQKKWVNKLKNKTFVRYF